MINKQELIDVINTELEGSDIFLVEVKVSADNIIDVAIDSMGSVTIDDCIALNNKVLDHFDRDVEDYELTVGSYGISDPFKVLQHYKKNMGGEVEVLTKDGKKLKGTLKDADEEGFTLTITKKVKLEGKKRPEMVDEDLNYKYDEIKYTKNIIQFKHQTMAKKEIETISLTDSFKEFKELKKIDKTTMISVLEESFRSVLAKIFGSDENFDVIMNPDNGDCEIYQNLEVVPDGEVEDPDRQIALTDARNDVDSPDPDCEVGEEHTRKIEFAKFGRRAILNLRQTLASKILDLQKTPSTPNSRPRKASW